MSATHTMPPAIEAARGAWLSQAREAAHRIALERGSVTVNDVRAVCPPPLFADPRILGAVFRDVRFARIGFRPSKRRECHGRPIGIFALRQ